ncbi:MAG: hypothetical protein U0232_24960 [Thermomicrobiales bacterium]
MSVTSPRDRILHAAVRHDHDPAIPARVRIVAQNLHDPRTRRISV